MALKTTFEDLDGPILLIDVGYLIHHRIFATYTWYLFNFEKPENVEEYDWTKDDEYMAMFEKRFFEGYKEIKEKYKISTKNMIFCKDCRRKNIWRKDHFPEYKENRIVKREPGKPNFYSIFPYVNDILLPKLEEKYNVKIIGNNYAEADDVIAILKKYIRNMEPTRKIIINASDKDLLQLSDDSTDIVNFKNEIINQDIDPGFELKIKFITGDFKDNVPALFSRCQRKTAIKIMDNKDLLKEKFLKNPTSIKQYELNKILLDFNKIPKEIKKDIIKEYLKCGK